MKRFHVPGQAAIAALVLFLLVGSACWAASYLTVSPRQGYFNGGSVYYLLTDVSDSALATTLNANFTPLLGNALNNPYIQYAYYVTNFAQGLVFSTQWPAPYAPTGNYMPICVLQTVTWTGGTPVVLKSVAAINAQAGNVMVRRTRIVVCASILINSLGASIPQGKVSMAGGVTIRLPIAGVFVGGTAYKMLRLDFGNLSEARVYGSNWAPMLAKFDIARAKLMPPAWQDIYSLWTTPPIFQLPVAKQVPSPFGPSNANALYSPIMTEWSVLTTGPTAAPYTSYAAIQAALLATRPTNYWANQPIIGP